MKFRSKSNLRNKALREFQKLRRFEDCERYGRCISCGCRITPYNSDGGHYIPRRIRSTELDPINVNAQCIECNRMMDGNHKAYRQGLIRRYGIHAVEQLETKARMPMPKKFAWDYEESIKDSEEKLRRFVK